MSSMDWVNVIHITHGLVMLKGDDSFSSTIDKLWATSSPSSSRLSNFLVHFVLQLFAFFLGKCSLTTMNHSPSPKWKKTGFRKFTSRSGISRIMLLSTMKVRASYYTVPILPNAGHIRCRRCRNCENPRVWSVNVQMYQKESFQDCRMSFISW